MVDAQILGLAAGTFPQWGAFITVLGILAGGVTVFIKGIPQRVKATSEAKQAENTDYASQLRDYRDEVHKFRNELAAALGEKNLVDSTSRRRADRIKNMLVVLRMVMSELRKNDPENVVLKHAETMIVELEKGEAEDFDKTLEWQSVKSAPLRSAEKTMFAAESTLHTAERTVEEVKATEAANQ